MKPYIPLAGLIALSSALTAAAQAPADQTEKAAAMIKEKWEARAPAMAKEADADKDGNLSETEFGPLWDAALKAKQETIKAVDAELGIPEPPPANSSGGKKGGGKKGGGKHPGKKGGAQKDPTKKEDAHKAKIAEAFKRADGNADGKVTNEEAAKSLISDVNPGNDPNVK